MQIVGEGNGGEKKGQDANQADEALPFSAIRGAFTQLRQPSQAPHERESDGDRQPDRVEEKLHAALILEQESGKGNRGGLSERLDDPPQGGTRKGRSDSEQNRTSSKQIVQGGAGTAVLLLHFRTGVGRHFGGVS